jgi:tetratricopeptide (TPR) repeat protein
LKPGVPVTNDAASAIQPELNDSLAVAVATSGGSQQVVANNVPDLTGSQISESADALELWFHFDKDFRHSLKRRSGNRYQFQISDAVSQIESPSFDGQWFDTLNISADQEHLLIDLVTAEKVLLSSSDIEQGNDYFWIVRLKRLKEDQVLQTASKPIVEPSENAIEQIDPEESSEQQEIARQKVKLAIKPAIQPESNQQRLESAVVNLQAGRWRQAMSQFQRLLSSDVDKQARLNLLALYQSRQMLGEFDGLLQSSVARYSNDGEFQIIDANRMFQKGLYQELVDRYTANTGSLQVISLTAAAYQRLGDHQLAVSAYQRALQADATQGKNWISLAISLEKLGQSDKALDAYQTALKSNGINSRLRQFVSGRIQALAAGN